MNSLLNYGSDDDNEDSPEEKPTDSYSASRSYRKPGVSKQVDVNYDEVQMSLSEDSSDDAKPSREQPKRRSRDRDDRYKEEGRRWNDEARNSPKSRDDYRSRKDRGDDRHASRTEKEEDRSRHSRDDDRTRDRYKEEERVRERRDDRRGKSKERYSRDDRYRDRKERDRKRSRSPRERRRSKSPRRSDRSRSKSKDRTGRGGYFKRFDRTNTKMERLDKMGIEIKTPDCQYVTPSDLQKSMGEEKSEGKDRFFVPGITGRFREQIEKRKLLWQKKEPEVKQQVAPAAVATAPIPGGSRTTKVWEATTFAQDTDGKVANKFKRLMGIKSVGEGSNTGTDVLKKQEEMFSSMEQQYEVARTATHTMRGVGLGFGSYQR